MILLLILFVFIIFAILSVLVLLSKVASLFYGAPFVPIKKKLVKEILTFGSLSSDDIFYDLGCGDGRVLISAVRDFGVKKAVGYEVSLWPSWIAKWKIRKAGLENKIMIYRKNFFDADLSGATFIYMYLFPKLVNQLAEKLASGCHSGTKILCPSFPIDPLQYPEFELLKTEKIATITVYLYGLSV